MNVHLEILTYGSHIQLILPSLQKSDKKLEFVSRNPSR